MKQKKRKKAEKKRVYSFKEQLLKGLYTISILLLLVILSGIIINNFFLVPDKIKINNNNKKEDFIFEIYPKQIKNFTKAKKKTDLFFINKKNNEFPKIAIIVDDLGYNLKFVKNLLSLNTVLTFSILPYGTYNKKIFNLLSKEKNIEIMLHLPMEPYEYPKIDPGEGALLMSMSSAEFIKQININIESIHGLKGVNNHMGSLITSKPLKIHKLFSILKKRNLFFIDSRTTNKTICKSVASDYGILFSERDIFIDHKRDKNFIKNQLKKLVKIAEKKGYAVGIGHPYKMTYKILKEFLPELKNKIKFVKASNIVKIVK